MEDQKKYKEIARQARIKIIEMIYLAQTSHVGSNMSCIDIMTVLFSKIDLDKDKFVLSKGWVAASLYYFLWKRGRISEEQLNSFCKEIDVICPDCNGQGENKNWQCFYCLGKGKIKQQSKFIGLAEPIIPEIMIAGGSMGLGLPGAVGLALAKKLKGEEGKVYVLMSDGEMQIGTTYESSLIASHYILNNLIVFIDYNHLQAMGETNHILRIEPLVDKWISWGWRVMEMDGHNYKEIENVWNIDWPTYIANKPFLDVPQMGLKPFKQVPILHLKPMVIICKTIKGKGVSFMENQNLYHYKAPSREEYLLAVEELK